MYNNIMLHVHCYHYKLCAVPTVSIIMDKQLHCSSANKAVYYIKIIEWFIDFSNTNKIDNLTCVIIHDNLETH